VFVTGGTGFVGRAVILRLLQRGCAVSALLRPGARERRAAFIERLEVAAASAPGTLSWVMGDIAHTTLGLERDGKAVLAGAAHVMHIAALYDVFATEDALTRVNVQGTQNVLDAMTELGCTGMLHHCSSIGVSGDHQGTFTEAMLQEGQSFEHPYQRTKFESEVLVAASKVPHRIYRPGSVVGDSKTGEMDRLDGIYYGFPTIQKLAAALPPWVRLPVPGSLFKGRFNIVPVDYVADAMVHIALNPDAKGTVFNLVDPKPPKFRKVVNHLMKVAGAPQMAPPVELGKLPLFAANAGRVFDMLPALRELRDGYLADGGLPSLATIRSMNLRVRFDDRNTQAALAGSGIACPPFKSYAKQLWRYYEDHLDPKIDRQPRYDAALQGKTVLVTGASRGVGAEVAKLAARHGATTLLVARTEERLEQVAAEIRDAGGAAHVYPVDLSSLDAIDALAKAVVADHGGVDVLVNNAARSIRRPIVDSVDRFHDYERTMGLNYFGPVRLTLGLLDTLRERKGAVSNVLTLGVLIPGPFFSAYLASKAALDAFGDSMAAELVHEGVHVSAIYLPLVKTEMIGPTKEYAGRRNVMTAAEAAVMVLDGVVDRKRRVMPGIGRWYAFSNRYRAASATRVMNVLQRIFPAGDRKTEFPVEKALLTQVLGGSPV